MNTYKKNAVFVGILFIITMAAGMIEANLISPILSGPLDAIYSNEVVVKVGAFLILAMAIGIVGIAILLFPVLKKQNETIAVTYVSFRIIECVFYIVGAIISLFLIALSQSSIKSDAFHAAQFQNLSNLAVTVKNSSNQIALSILGLGSSVLFGYLLFRSKIFPKWLSAWGLIGYVFLLASALLDIVGVVDSVHGVGMILYIPGGIFEVIVFPIWLVLKGFHLSADSVP